jgi:hypothetical protein
MNEANNNQNSTDQAVNYTGLLAAGWIRFDDDKEPETGQRVVFTNTIDYTLTRYHPHAKFR